MEYGSQSKCYPLVREFLNVVVVVGSMPEWLMGADCKSADESQRWFKSSSAQISDVRHGNPAASSGVGKNAR